MAPALITAGNTGGVHVSDPLDVVAEVPADGAVLRLEAIVQRLVPDAVAEGRRRDCRKRKRGDEPHAPHDRPIVRVDRVKAVAPIRTASRHIDSNVIERPRRHLAPSGERPVTKR